MPCNHSDQPGKAVIRGVIFDYGNVLSLPQEPRMVEQMAQVCGIDSPSFRDRYWKFRPSYDRGELDGHSYWNLVAKARPFELTGEQITELISLDMRSWSRPNQATVAWARQLRQAGICLAVLSNMPAELSRWLSGLSEWASLFDHLTFSCDLGRMKPDPAIYQACLEKMELPPQEVLFLDDVDANVAGAEAVGIHAVLFDTAERAVERVRERYELPVPEKR